MSPELIQYTPANEHEPFQHQIKHYRSTQVFKGDRKHYLKQFYEELDKSAVDKSQQNNLQKNVLKFLFNVTIFLGNFIGLLVYVISTYIDIGVVEDPQDRISDCELGIAVIFTLEYLFDIWKNRYSPSVLLSRKSVIDLLTIIPIYFELYYSDTHWVFSVLKVLRSLRIIRFFNLIHYFIYVQQNKIFGDQEQQQEQYEMSENKKVTLVFFMTFAHIVSIIFMSTGIIMMFEELLPYRAFLSGSDYVQMDFTKGVYFMIATMSTIGYGDFAPAHSIVRGWLTVTLLVVVSIVSTDITQLTECLRGVSEYETHYNFQNHIVVIGQYNEFYLWDFLHNFFAELEPYPLQLKNTKILIIGSREPSPQIESILMDLELLEKVYYLKCSLLESSLIKRANLYKAKALYSFADTNPNQTDNEKKDNYLGLFLFLKNLHFLVPHVAIIVFYGDQVRKHTKLHFKIKEEVRAQQMKSYILGTMCMNKGIQVMISHLTRAKYLKEKIPNELCIKYAQSTFQSIFRVVTNPIFIGQLSIEVMKTLYYSSMLYNKTKRLHSESDYDTSAIILLGFYRSKKTNIMLAKSIEGKYIKQKFVPVYDNVLMRKGDMLLVMCSQHQVNFISELTQEDAEWKHEQMQQTFNFDQNESHDLVTRMIEAQIKMYKDDKFTKNGKEVLECHVITQHVQDALMTSNRLKNHQFSQTIGSTLCPNETGIINTITITNGYINLYQESSQQIELQLENHIIIFGPKIGLTNIVQGIRRYTQRYIVFFSEDMYNESEMVSVIKRGRFLYAYGSYFNITHLRAIRLKKSTRVLILTDKTTSDQETQDMNCLILMRAIYSLAPNADVVFELQESNSLNHCIQRPNSELQNDFQFYPQVLSGNVFIGSSIYTILSRCVNNECLIEFVKLIIRYKQKLSTRTQMEKRILMQGYLIHTLTLDNEAVEHFAVYGCLAITLLENKLYFQIPLGIITSNRSSLQNMLDEKKLSQKRQRPSNLRSSQDRDEMKRQQNKQLDLEHVHQRRQRMSGSSRPTPSSSTHLNQVYAKLEQFRQKQKLQERVKMNTWDGSTVITNPPALHILLPGDKIMVFGDFLDIQEKQKSPIKQSQIQEQSLFRMINTIQEEEESNIQEIFVKETSKFASDISIQERINLKTIVIASLKSIIKLLKQMEVQSSKSHTLIN